MPQEACPLTSALQWLSKSKSGTWLRAERGQADEGFSAQQNEVSATAALQTAEDRLYRGEFVRGRSQQYRHVFRDLFHAANATKGRYQRTLSDDLSEYDLSPDSVRDCEGWWDQYELLPEDELCSAIWYYCDSEMEFDCGWNEACDGMCDRLPTRSSPIKMRRGDFTDVHIERSHKDFRCQTHSVSREKHYSFLDFFSSRFNFCSIGPQWQSDKSPAEQYPCLDRRVLFV